MQFVSGSATLTVVCGTVRYYAPQNARPSGDEPVPAEGHYVDGPTTLPEPTILRTVPNMLQQSYCRGERVHSD